MQTLKLMLVVAVAVSNLAMGLPARAQEPSAVQMHETCTSIQPRNLQVRVTSEQ